MPENSYQSARKDAIRAGVVIGAGYLAYKGYKKLTTDDDWAKAAIGLLALPSFVMTTLFFVPFFFVWRIRVLKNAESRLMSLESEMRKVELQMKKKLEYLECLPVSHSEKERILEPYEKRLDKLWDRAALQAELMVTALSKERRLLERERLDLVQSARQAEPKNLKCLLEVSGNRMGQIAAVEKNLFEKYEAEPSESLLLVSQFGEQYRRFLLPIFVIFLVPGLFLTHAILEGS